MQHFNVTRDSQLRCPICYASEKCKKHLVERWEGDNRPSFLKKILDELDCPITIAERLLQTYPTPESRFDDAILISWKSRWSSPPVEHGALFHPEGSKLLERYREFIESQVQAPQRLHSILKDLQPVPPPKKKVEAPKRPIVPKKAAVPLPPKPVMVLPQRVEPDFESEDPEKLADELVQYLV